MTEMLMGMEHLAHIRLQPPVEPSRPSRIPANASLRPVSIPDVVSDMSCPNPICAVADFDRHYMPNGAPDPDMSVRGIADEHRSELKRMQKTFHEATVKCFRILLMGQSHSLEMITNICTILLFK